VLRGMLILGGVAAAHMAARKTKPQMNPGVTQLHTIFADMLIGFGDLDLVCMLAIHVCPRFLRTCCWDAGAAKSALRCRMVGDRKVRCIRVRLRCLPEDDFSSRSACS